MKRLLWIAAMTAAAVGLSSSGLVGHACEPDPCVTTLFCHAACSRCAVPQGSLDDQKVCLWP